MPPEQYHGIVSPKNDVYSLGVVFYEMLTGRRSNSRFSFIPIEKINAKVSPKLAELIHKCLNLDQLKRPSVDEIYNSLLRMQNKRN